MTPEETIRERILDLASVTALVGSRVYQLRLPQGGTLPAVRVQLIDDVTGYHLRGGAGIQRARVQVDAYAAETSGADPYADALEVADAIHGEDAGDGLSGWVGTAGSPSVAVVACLRDVRSVGYDAEELRQVRVRQDYVVSWKRN